MAYADMRAFHPCPKELTRHSLPTVYPDSWNLRSRPAWTEAWVPGLQSEPLPLGAPPEPPTKAGPQQGQAGMHVPQGMLIPHARRPFCLASPRPLRCLSLPAGLPTSRRHHS